MGDADSADDALVLAFEQAAGREAVAVLPEPVLAFARRVVGAGRRALALPACPASLIRKAEGLFTERRGLAAAKVGLLRLLFDSWESRGAAAASVRGKSHARFLRFGADGTAMDVELAPAADGGIRVRGTVEAEAGDLSVHVTSARGRSAAASVKVGGAFGLDLPPGAGAFTLTVKSGKRALFRTSRIPPRGRAA